MVKQKEYVGESFRRRIKELKVTNGYVIKGLSDAGIKLSDTVFSNKIYGVRDTFNEQESEIINNILFVNNPS